MFESFKSIFSASGKKVEKTESGAVNKEVSAMLAEGGMNVATESEVARTEAMNLISADKRIKKVYDFYSDKPDMQEKYVQAVIKFGEDVGAFRKETGQFEKASWSGVPEMAGTSTKITKQAETFKVDAERLAAAEKFFSKLPDTAGKWSKLLGNMSPEEKEEFFAKFAKNPEVIIKSAAYDEDKKEFVSKAKYEVKL